MASQVYSGTVKKNSPLGLKLGSFVAITISDGNCTVNGNNVPDGVAIVSHSEGEEHVFGSNKLAEHFNFGDKLQ